MPNILPANRVAAIATWLAGLAGLILAVEGTFPQAWQNAALGVAALLTKLVTTLKFLEGSQRSEALASNPDDRYTPPADVLPVPSPAGPAAV